MSPALAGGFFTTSANPLLILSLIEVLLSLEQVSSLSWEDPLEKKMSTHFSILAWRIPWTEEPETEESMGLRTVGHS